MNDMTPQTAAKADAPRLPVFQQFIDELRDVWAAEPDIAKRMEQARPLLERLVKDDELKARSAD